MSAQLGIMPFSKRLGALAALMANSSSSIAASSPDAVLERFIEILKTASPAVRLAISFSTPIIMLFTAISKYSTALRMLAQVRDMLTYSITSQISIGAKHPLQQQIMAYLTENGLKNTRRLALTQPASQRSSSSAFPFGPFGPSGAGTARGSSDEHKQENLKYIPDVGTYDFVFKGYRMRFERSSAQVQARLTDGTVRNVPQGDIVVLSCWSLFAGTKPIKEFLDHIKSLNAESGDPVTTFYRPTGAPKKQNEYGEVVDPWDDGVPRPRRKLAAVTLDAHIADPLIKDIRDYLDPRTRQFYINNGIPYRKGYLIYGPPGTGKTSFASALAGEYGLDVYLLSLEAGMNDRTLEHLFEMLPAKCIVLMEDVDSAGVKRETMNAEPKPKPKSKGRSKAQKAQDKQEAASSPASTAPARSGVTLSGLLNVLDGVTAAEGRIVILTTNNPDSLDKALVRPGRIDKKVLFGNASHEVATKMFTRIFTKSQSELLDGEVPFADIERLAKEFADQIPVDTVSPARVQGHLLGHRTDPEAAVATIAALVAEVVEENRSGKNVAGFDPRLGPASADGETSDDDDDEDDEEESGYGSQGSGE